LYEKVTMAMLGSLFSGALPFLGNALRGGISGLAQAVQRGGGIGDALKGGALGALSGLVGQPDQEERMQPKAIRDAPEFEPSNPKLIQRIRVPQMFKKKKRVTRRK
jgi:hypothetical protein